MARFTPGAAMSALSGSVGGVTFGRDRNGPIMRSCQTRSTRPNQLMATSSATLVAAAQTWRTYADARRKRWEAAARTTPRQDSLGRTYYLSGYSYFCECYCKALASGLVPGADPSPQVPQPAPVLTFGTVSVATGVLQIQRGPTSTAVAARVVSASRPLSPGQSSFHHVETRICFMGAGTGMANRYNNYSSAWFPLGSQHIGMKVLFRLQNVSDRGMNATTVEAVLTLT